MGNKWNKYFFHGSRLILLTSGYSLITPVKTLTKYCSPVPASILISYPLGGHSSLLSSPPLLLLAAALLSSSLVLVEVVDAAFALAAESAVVAVVEEISLWFADFSANTFADFVWCWLMMDSSSTLLDSDSDRPGLISKAKKYHMKEKVELVLQLCRYWILFNNNAIKWYFTQCTYLPFYLINNAMLASVPESTFSMKGSGLVGAL